MKVIGEEELPQPESMEFIKEMDSVVLKMKCPEELCSIKEEDLVVWVSCLIIA
jgi:hypothetical protein